MAPVSPDDVTLEPAAPTDPEAAELIVELNAMLDGLYHPDDNHFALDPADVRGDQGAFFLARREGETVGCGAVRLLGGGLAEVKRMYVRPQAQGARVGRRILALLESEARMRGATQLVLEMGDRQPAARRLYESFGFEAIPCWGEYLATPSSVCLGKRL